MLEMEAVQRKNLGSPDETKSFYKERDEFVTLDGETVAVVSVHASQVRPVGQREIAHVRALEYA